jgi:endogenous inhibitor of DNA gyrase (YacG/DUF329 family)
MYIFNYPSQHFKFKCDECEKEVEGHNDSARPHLIVLKHDDLSLDKHFCSEYCQEKYGQKHYNWLPRF